MSEKVTNESAVFSNLELMKTLENQIKTAGITQIKPLAQQLAKLTHSTLARLSMEVFKK